MLGQILGILPRFENRRMAVLVTTRCGRTCSCTSTRLMSRRSNRGLRSNELGNSGSTAAYVQASTLRQITSLTFLRELKSIADLPRDDLDRVMTRFEVSECVVRNHSCAIRVGQYLFGGRLEIYSTRQTCSPVQWSPVVLSS